MTISTPTQSSQKANAIIALYELGGQSRELEPVLTQMRKRGINSDIHNLAHLMWPLSREGAVTFLERKTGPRSSSTLVNISLTDRGKDRAMALLGISIGKLPDISGRGRSTHSVGRDATDFRLHGKTAVGGPIEVIKKENPLDHVPFVVLPDEDADKFRQKRRPAQIAKPVIDENPVAADTEVPSKDAEVPAMPAEVPAAPADTHTEYSLKPHLTLDAASFPELTAVMAKADKVARFTKAAELLGDDEAELAIAILEKVQITPLEAEIIRLLG